MQQENTVFAVLPTEDVATFPFLADVELGKGITNRRMKESGGVTQETKHDRQKLYCFLMNLFRNAVI